MYVPVIYEGTPLMPTTFSRARRWIRCGRATPFWNHGIFCVRLNTKPSGFEVQETVSGIDPGLKEEGFTIKSEAHTYLNVQAAAVTWVKKHVEQRRMMRRSRRGRNTPCRARRSNRKIGGIPPSTLARWGWKLRIVNWLRNIFPISVFMVENIKARTWAGGGRWNRSFSPLQVGKQWFYEQLTQLGGLELKQGWETSQLRSDLGLTKTKDKRSTDFDAHCVDSWVLANYQTGGHLAPDNTNVLRIIPLQFHRRQLHKLQPEVGGVRSLYGGTRSLGFKRGSLVKHPKYGLTYVGGTSHGRITLHSLVTGERLTRNVKPEDCKFLCYSSFRAVQ